MTKLIRFDHKNVEVKLRDIWKRKGIYSPNLKNASKPFYNLMMFPYPSAEGLHVGNMYAFTGADIFGRFNRMRGFDVFEPIGLDGFGIHSENFAIKIGRHPKEHAKISEKHFYNQLSIIGDGYAWNRRLETYDPDYYRWTQWLFVKMFKNGLAYKGSAMVNWCPSCKTVLADEQVIDEKCERCKTEVIKREMSSWFFRITKYADRLLNNIDGIEKNQNTEYGLATKEYDVKRYGLRWPEKIKTAQRTWIGKKAGINIEYKLDGFKESLTCFTTVPVNWGATFIVIAPEHHLVKKVIAGGVGTKETDVGKIKQYVEKALSKSEQQRKLEEKGKTGVFTGLYVINHVTGKRIPVWISDFVLSSVGTGAVQGCPGHDQRDWDFAKKYGIPIIRVVTGPNGEENDIYKAPQIVHLGDKGKMINSDFLNGIDFTEGMVKTMDYFEEKGWGKRIFDYHLRDWLISRQRYWGPPIPMIFCKKCASEGKSWFTTKEGITFKGPTLQGMAGWFPVPEEDLPVQLPDIKDFKPKGDGSSPLANAPQSWKEVKCPNCEGKAIRELDVSDTFLDSSWYFLAYPNLGTPEWKKGESPFNKEITTKWLPVDAYIGGAEHAVLHLLYSRFVTMALHDWGYLAFEEPFPFLFGHGLLIKDGAKMSKSKGNVVSPDDYIERFGADTLRAYLMFLGPYDQGGDFRDTGIEGMKRFIDKVWRLVNSYKNSGFLDEKDKKEIQVKMHQTIEKVTKDIQEFGYNTAIAALMEFVNVLQEKSQSLSCNDLKTTKIKKGESKLSNRETVWQEALKNLILLLAPFAPHLAEEAWIEVFNEKFSVHNQPWPKYDLKFIKVDKMTFIIQIDGKVRSQLTVSSILSTNKGELEKIAQSDSVTAKWLKGKKVIKTVFVPGRLINFVTK